MHQVNKRFVHYLLREVRHKIILPSVRRDGSVGPPLSSNRPFLRKSLDASVSRPAGCSTSTEKRLDLELVDPFRGSEIAEFSREIPVLSEESC